MWIAVWTGDEAKCIAEHKRVSAGGGSSGILWAPHQPHSASPDHHSLWWRSLDEYLAVRGAVETSLGGATECRWTIRGFKVSVTGSSSGVVYSEKLLYEGPWRWAWEKLQKVVEWYVGLGSSSGVRGVGGWGWYFVLRKTRNKVVC